VIVLDLAMPEMDGWTFMRMQQEDPALAGIPVIVLSAVPTSPQPISAAAVCEKPMSLDDLVACIRGVLKSRPSGLGGEALVRDQDSSAVGGNPRAQM
jgi:CheY-like chemotaxis protein